MLTYKLSLTNVGKIMPRLPRMHGCDTAAERIQHEKRRELTS